MTSEAISCDNCEQLSRQLAQQEQQILLLQARIEELGRHDPLTGVLNRRGLTEILDAELQRAQRTGHPFCFAVIDLDHFHSINAQHGHAAADTVLKTAAETAIKLLRTVDRFGRLDGEEFGIVLPATWIDQGMIAMQRLAKAIGDCRLDAIEPKITLTISAGLTTNAFGDTVESMIKRAEQVLNQARQDGGNRIAQAEEPLPDAPPIDLS